MAAIAGPEALLPETWAEGVTWEAQAVRLAAPGEVRPVEPFVPAFSWEQSGRLTVSRNRAAVVHLRPLEVLRVRASKGIPRFERVPTASHPDAAWIRLEEPGVAARKDLWYLAEPMGGGSLWLILSDDEAEIEVQRPEPLERALSDEAVRAGILAWIDRGGTRPPLPFHPELRHQLDRDLEVATLLGEALPKEAPTKSALQAYRKASALRAWTLIQPLRQSSSRLTTHLPKGENIPVEGSSQPLALPPGENGRWELEARGPGVLAVDVRRVFGAGETGDAVIEVYDGETLLGRAVAPARGAYSELAGLPLPLGRTLRQTPQGRQLGPNEELRVPLREGRHAYRIEWRAGAVALRAVEARRRPWLSDTLGAADWQEWAAQATKLLGADASVQAVLLRRELARLDPRLPAPSQEVPLELLSPALRPLAAIGAQSFGQPVGNTGAALAATLKAAPLPPEGALGWSLRLELADHLIDAGLFEEARTLMRAAPTFPPSGWLAASAARRVARLPSDAGLRSRELAALELAWRKEPLSLAIRSDYARRFYDSARWRTVAPRGRDERPQVRRWLDLREVPGGAAAGAGALVAISPGESVQVTVPDAEAPRQVRLYVLGEPGAKGVTLQVGARSFPVPQVEALEPVELALPAGSHLLQIQGPPGVRVFAPASGAPTPSAAYVRAQWALRTGSHPVRFRIPDGQLPTPIRLALRPDGPRKGPLALWLRTDVGEARRLWLHPGQPSEDARALELGGRKSVPTASVTLHLPALVREVWLDVDDAAPEEDKKALLHGSVAIRVAEGDRKLASPSTPPDAALLEKLLTLSRELDTTSEDAGRLLARARLLLDAGEEGLARGDLDRALDLPAPLTESEARQALELMDRLEEEDTRLPFAQPITEPTLLRPAMGALPEKHVDSYLAARRQVAEDRTADGLFALAALYRDAPVPQLGLETLALVERAQLEGSERWTKGVAAIGYGIASQLAPFGELPILRRVRTETARWTRWDRLADAEQQAGAVSAEQEAPPEEAMIAIRKALLAPPWALDEGRVVRSGTASVLDLTLPQPDTFGAEVLCRTWPIAQDAAPGPCKVSLRVDGVVAIQRQVAHGELARLDATVATAGKHQLELVVEDDDAPRVAVVRFLRLGGALREVALEPRRPLTFLRSSPSLPVTMTVLGPTVLRVAARSLGAQAPRTLHVATERTQPSSPEAGDAPSDSRGKTLELQAGADPSVTGAPAPVGAEAELVILLPEAGPHRVRLESPDGDVLVRVRTAGSERPHPVSQTQPPELRRAEPLPWPALPERLTLMPDATVEGSGGALGMLSLELGASDERLSDQDQVTRALRAGLEAAASYRRELVQEAWWVRAALSSRVLLDRAPAFGGAVAVHGRRLPLDLRLSLSARAALQSLDGGMRWSAGGRASVDRWVSLTSDLALIPSVAVDLQTQHGAADGDRYDLSVYSRYDEQHPLRVIPRASLRWLPLQDQVGSLAGWASTNSDSVSLDHATGELSWSSLWTSPLSPVRTDLGYGLSYRFDDAHRSAAYLRHHLRLAADWAVWTTSTGRLLVFVEDRLHYSNPFGLQNVAGAGLRWDFSGGRGLRDIAPPEEEFEHLLDPRRFIQ
ncbi:MAG: hypothetical protein M3Y59_12175 [Myxococcota bacterium]|nr:hypothetical protein [Myxococcota bacterium]